MIVTGSDGYAKFQVADGSTFEIFPDSQVMFRNSMGVGELLNVMIGKIKVWIQHAPGIPNPNSVATPTALISVRGTVFIVDVKDTDGTTDVDVDEGIVDVRNLRMGGQVRLIQGQAPPWIRVCPWSDWPGVKVRSSSAASGQLPT